MGKLFCFLVLINCLNKKNLCRTPIPLNNSIVLFDVFGELLAPPDRPLPYILAYKSRGGPRGNCKKC